MTHSHKIRECVNVGILPALTHVLVSHLALSLLWKLPQASSSGQYFFAIDFSIKTLKLPMISYFGLAHDPFLTIPHRKVSSCVMKRCGSSYVQKGKDDTFA